MDEPVWLPQLLRPDAYPTPVERVQLFETHISWVFVAGEYAYKLKKPVHFEFVDFSTIERRRAACEAEVALNRRLCPDLYLGVRDLVIRDGIYSFEGEGAPVEPAVWMRRLPAEGMMPAMLARGAVDASLVRRIARILARFHGRAATGAGVDELAGPETIELTWRENLHETEPFIGHTITQPAFDLIRAYVTRFLVQHRALLETRVQEGRARECHGDLHSGNICIVNGAPKLFDCIEFNRRLRCTDVAADVGFLAMDLEHAGRRDLAEAFAGQYVRTAGDTTLPAVLDFYVCARAFVRGKVLSLKLAEAEGTEDRATADEARAYFDLAWRHAGGLGGPTLVVVMGLPASGKTTLASSLARRLGIAHISSDIVRKRLAGIPPTERGGGPLYSAGMTRRTYAAINRTAGRRLRAGESVVVDATYGDPRARTAVRRLARNAGARLIPLLCTADESELQNRLAARAEAKDVVSDARLETWPRLRAAFRPPDEWTDVHRIDAGVPARTASDAAMRAIRAVAASSS